MPSSRTSASGPLRSCATPSSRPRRSPGSASPRTGWVPRHLTLRDGGRLVAAAPAWARPESHGDFSANRSWRSPPSGPGSAGIRSWSIGVPFTPSTGRRFLVAPGEDRARRVAQLATRRARSARRRSSAGIQVLFLDAEEARELEAAGFALRVDYQFHWRNEGYRSFDEFLARFSSRRRNSIRRELAEPARRGISIRTVTGEELARDPGRWAHDCFGLHRAAVERLRVGRAVRQRGLLRALLADDAGRGGGGRGAPRGAGSSRWPSTSTTATRLHGRYWGYSEEHPFLHFNVALYHSIGECIRRGVAAFEPGAGGEHKLSRGFEPVETWSAMLPLEPGLDAAMRELPGGGDAARAARRSRGGARGTRGWAGSRSAATRTRPCRSRGRTRRRRP